MDHRMMMGMFLGGLVMMAPPVLLGIGIAVHVYRRWRADSLAGSPAAGRRPGHGERPDRSTRGGEAI